MTFRLCEGAGYKQPHESDKVLIARPVPMRPCRRILAGKLPRWLRERVGSGLTVDISTGLDFPQPERIRAHPPLRRMHVLRKQLMSRIIKADAENVPITNYGYDRRDQRILKG